MIRYIDIPKGPTTNEKLDFTVTTDGLKITVLKNTANIAGREYELEEDAEHTATPDASISIGVSAMLVADKDGKLHVMIDEIRQDGRAVPFNYSTQEQYTPLINLYDLVVPPMAPNLDQVELRLLRFVKPSVEVLNG